ncbi:hypothetical protein RCU60_19635, partial [Escherichia coli]|nr:hypothetical protein [Escherichia coli]
DHGVIQKIPLSPGRAGQSGTKLVFVPGCQQTSHVIALIARQCCGEFVSQVNKNHMLQQLVSSAEISVCDDLVSVLILCLCFKSIKI